MSELGTVYLVGAGPGDPDLLTVKALRLIQAADVILYDRLVSEPIMALCNSAAERLYVGKARSDHAVPQNQINEFLVSYAQQGKTVVRLKGGDPFIFGRGGEELETLAENGINFEIVPGVTAASGCAAYAGIPLTHRDYAQTVRFVTGHLKNGVVDLNGVEYLNDNETLVIYMGLVGLGQITEHLLAAGRDPETPVALVQQGTTPHQKVVEGSLASIVKNVAEQEVKPPTLIIIGGVVSLRKQLAWFTPQGE